MKASRHPRAIATYRKPIGQTSIPLLKHSAQAIADAPSGWTRQRGARARMVR
jgi:hypothetical protein